MKIFIFILCLLIMQNLFANNFSHKKIIKIQNTSDHFELIDLDQKVQNTNIDQQKGIFDSSKLHDKKQTNIKDNEIDYAILIGFKNDFAYILNQTKIIAKDFSTLFSKNLIPQLKLNLINSQANGMYQTQKTLNNFAPNKNFQILNITPFLKKEKNKNKIYAKYIDYLLVINLDEFYINITNFLITRTQTAYAKINFKIINTSNAKILSAKNITLKLKLDPKIEKNYEVILEQMPKMLAEAILKEISKLKLNKI